MRKLRAVLGGVLFVMMCLVAGPSSRAVDKDGVDVWFTRPVIDKVTVQPLGTPMTYRASVVSRLRMGATHTFSGYMYNITPPLHPDTPCQQTKMTATVPLAPNSECDMEYDRSVPAGQCNTYIVIYYYVQGNYTSSSASKAFNAPGP